MKTVQVTKEDLRDILFDEKGSTIIAGRYMGYLDMRKTGNPYIGATQDYRFTAWLNWDYEKAVERRRKKHLTLQNYIPFVASPRSWGIHLMDGSRLTCVVLHKGLYYMNSVLDKCGRRTFRFQGHIIPGSLVVPFMPNKPAFAKSQGLKYEDSVKVRDFGFDNLKWIQLHGVKYTLI